MTSYHDRPEISSTQIRAALTSPIALHRAMTGTRAETEAMRLGTAIHEAVLEPDKYAARQVQTRLSWATKDGKAQKAQWEAMSEAEQRTWLWDAESEQIAPLVDAWHAWNGRWIDTHGRPFIPDSALIESEIFWEDEGTPCRCKPDALVVDQGRNLARIVSLKSAREGWPAAYRKALHSGRYSVGYDVSEYHYLRGVSAHYGIPIERIASVQIVLCKESQTCYAYDTHAAALAAEARWRVGVQRIARYREDPGAYVGGPLITVMDPPPWVAQVEDDEA